MSRSLVSGLWCCLAPALASAQGGLEEAVRFQYEAPSTCPDGAAFTKGVRERTQRGRLAEPGELGRTFSVVVSMDASGFSGSVEFLDEQGERVSRSVRGAECGELVSGLALITALALDASVSEVKVAEIASSPVVADVSPRTEGRAGSGERSKAATRARPMRDGSLLGAGVGFEAGYDTPLDAFSLGVLGGIVWRSGVSARLLAHFSTTERDVDEGRRANLRLMALEGSLCPSRERLGPISLYPCLAVDLGTLRAEGLKGGALATSSSSAIFWASVGPQARLAWEPDAPLWLEVNAALAFPLVRHEFVFTLPQATVFEVPLVSAGVGVASGVRFW